MHKPLRGRVNLQSQRLGGKSSHGSKLQEGLLQAATPGAFSEEAAVAGETDTQLGYSALQESRSACFGGTGDVSLHTRVLKDFY